MKKDDDTYKEIEISSRTDDSSTEIQPDAESKIGDEHIHIISPLPDSSSKGAKDSNWVDKTMSNVTPRVEDDQAAELNQGRKRDVHEGQNPEKPSRVSPACKQMQWDEQDMRSAGKKILYTNRLSQGKPLNTFNTR